MLFAQLSKAVYVGWVVAGRAIRVLWVIVVVVLRDMFLTGITAVVALRGRRWRAVSGEECLPPFV